MYEYEIQRFLTRHGYLGVVPKAALIDMDGTLYDSMPRHAAAWMELCREIGIDATPDEFFRYEGRTGASTINILFQRAFGRDATEDEARRLYQRKTELFSAMPDVDVMPGAYEMTKFLKEVGVKRVLVTGSGQNSLIRRIEADFPGIFQPSLMVTGRDVKHGKPHPEPFFKGMELTGVRPDECMVIENAPLGVKAGDASGAFTIGVNTGPLGVDELRDSGAAVVFNSMQECSDAMPLMLYALITNSRNFN